MQAKRNQDTGSTENSTETAFPPIPPGEDDSARLKNLLLDKDHEIEALTNENAEQAALIHEIYTSKAWKLITLLRRIRLFVAPHNSMVEKTARKFLKPLAGISRAMKSSLPKRKKLRFEKTLSAILEENSGAKDILIFAPSVNWNIALFQRPQHLALHFAKQGVLTLYIEPQDSSQEKSGFRKIQERLYLCKVPLETFRIIDSPAVIFLSYNKKFLPFFTNPRVIYEYIDELTVFPGNYSQLKKDHLEYLKTADVVVATAKRLYDQVAPLRPDTLLVMNGVNYEHFHKAGAENIQVPPDMLPLVKKGQPVIGYYGALAKWFDYELVRELASLRRDLTFVLIGPAYDKSMAESEIDTVANIHWLGVKDYKILPDYLFFFDAAFIPFRLNAITHSTSPLKLFEFMAGNKPVVITPMHESMRIEGVLVADGAQEFSKKIDEALALRHDPDYIRRIDAVSRENTWEHRSQQIMNGLAAAGPREQEAKEPPGHGRQA